jgi:hypothetical protein
MKERHRLEVYSKLWESTNWKFKIKEGTEYKGKIKEGTDWKSTIKEGTDWKCIIYCRKTRSGSKK